MAITTSTIQAFTAAEMLTMYEYAAAQLAVGGKVVKVGDRTITRADENFVWKMIDRYKQIVDQSSYGTTGIVEFGVPSA